MHFSNLLISIFIASLTAGLPTSGQNQAITPSEWEALRVGGIAVRSETAQNVSISPDSLAALKSSGLYSRTEFEKRDKLMSCGMKVDGKTRAGGKGKWVPVDQFKERAKIFCVFLAKLLPFITLNIVDQATCFPAPMLLSGTKRMTH